MPFYPDDPELGDENDPEYKEQLFQTMRYMKTLKLENFDEKFAQEYKEWLAKQE